MRGQPKWVLWCLCAGLWCLFAGVMLIALSVPISDHSISAAIKLMLNFIGGGIFALIIFRPVPDQSKER